MLKISELCNISSGGTPSRNKPEYWNGGNIPWVRSEVCKEGYVSSSDEYITELGLQNSNAKLFSKGTTLIALVGATKGKTAYLEFETTTNQNIAGIKTKDENILQSKFLFFILRSMYDDLILNLSQYDMLNLGNIREIKIPVPPLDIQQKIVSEIEALERKISDLENAIVAIPKEKEAILKQQYLQ